MLDVIQEQNIRLFIADAAYSSTVSWRAARYRFEFGESPQQARGTALSPPNCTSGIGMLDATFLIFSFLSFEPLQHSGMTV
jgi:hypothetical protein